MIYRFIKVVHLNIPFFVQMESKNTLMGKKRQKNLLLDKEENHLIFLLKRYANLWKIHF